MCCFQCFKHLVIVLNLHSQCNLRLMQYAPVCSSIINWKIMNVNIPASNSEQLAGILMYGNSSIFIYSFLNLLKLREYVETREFHFSTISTILDFQFYSYLLPVLVSKKVIFFSAFHLILITFLCTVRKINKCKNCTVTSHINLLCPKNNRKVIPFDTRVEENFMITFLQLWYVQPIKN